MRDTGDKMNGGAVIEDKSPENEAMLEMTFASVRVRYETCVKTDDFRNDVQPVLWAAGTA